MTTQPPERPHLLFLFSDTGGGHRSAAEAIIEALCQQYGERISTTMVDIFREYAPRPLNYVPRLYTHVTRLPRAWGIGYRLSNGRRRARLITAGAWPYVRHRVRSLIAGNPSDLIVSVHPLANAPALRALRSQGKKRPAFITVVTDLVSTHALWYHRRVDLCLVPTEMAHRRALDFGLRPSQVRVTGLPVASRFCHPAGDPGQIRARLGWPMERPVILLVGGGEGMGPLEKTAHAIASAGLPTTLVIVAGRNQALQARLEAYPWPIPTFVYGFVYDMPDFMRAADVLVTKAGPGTISEAFIAGLPLLLYARLPGQEEGNVDYVTSQGAGVWTPRPEQLTGVLREWLENPERRRQAAEASRNLARPQAAGEIARILAARLGVE